LEVLPETRAQELSEPAKVALALEMVPPPLVVEKVTVVEALLPCVTVLGVAMTLVMVGAPTTGAGAGCWQAARTIALVMESARIRL